MWTRLTVGAALTTAAALLATSSSAMVAQVLRDTPYVQLLTPTECLVTGEQLPLSWRLVVTGTEEDLSEELRLALPQSEVCISLGSQGEPNCVPAMSGDGSTLYLSALPDGCHTVVAWWRVPSSAASAAHSWQSPATSKTVTVGTGCEPGGCTEDAAAMAMLPGDRLASAYGPPPNALTGGCLLGEACRCQRGCCESASPLSQCEHASFPGGSARRLPLCSECLGDVLPAAKPDWLPRFRAGAPFVALAKALVTNAAYEDPLTASFDHLTALTMVRARPPWRLAPHV